MAKLSTGDSVDREDIMEISSRAHRSIVARHVIDELADIIVGTS